MWSNPKSKLNTGSFSLCALCTVISLLLKILVSSSREEQFWNNALRLGGVNLNIAKPISCLMYSGPFSNLISKTNTGTNSLVSRGVFVYTLTWQITLTCWYKIGFNRHLPQCLAMAGLRNGHLLKPIICFNICRHEPLITAVVWLFEWLENNLMLDQPDFSRVNMPSLIRWPLCC